MPVLCQIDYLNVLQHNCPVFLAALNFLNLFLSIWIVRLITKNKRTLRLFTLRSLLLEHSSVTDIAVVQSYHVHKDELHLANSFTL